MGDSNWPDARIADEFARLYRTVNGLPGEFEALKTEVRQLKKQVASLEASMDESQRPMSRMERYTVGALGVAFSGTLVTVLVQLGVIG